MRRVASPLRTSALVACALTATLWASVGIALGAPTETALDLESWRGSDYASDGAAQAPVSADLLGDLYAGKVPQDLLPALDPTVGLSPPALDTDEGGVVTPIEEEEREIVPPPPGPSLRLKFRADRKRARPGEEITYTVHVENVGRATARNALVQSHVPEGTTLVTGTDCDGNAVQIQPGGDDAPVCLNVQPPAPNPEGHITYFYASIPAGGSEVWTFRVRVNDVEPGTPIVNHAHASADGLPTITSDDVTVTVA